MHVQLYSLLVCIVVYSQGEIPNEHTCDDGGSNERTCDDGGLRHVQADGELFDTSSSLSKDTAHKDTKLVY